LLCIRLITKYGYHPRMKSTGDNNNNNNNHHHDYDGNFGLLDQISQKMIKMEKLLLSQQQWNNNNNTFIEDDFINNNNNNNSSFINNNNNNPLSSPLPSSSSRHNNNSNHHHLNHSISWKTIQQRIRKLEENMIIIESSQVEHQQRYQQLQLQQEKLQQQQQQQQSASSSTSISPQQLQLQLQQWQQERILLSETQNKMNFDVKENEKKIRKLAENTQKACKSLSHSLSELQEATLNLFSWSDDVYQSFQIVTKKINIQEMICPRAKIQHYRQQQRERQQQLLLKKVPLESLDIS
jgi:hypothetical protein